MRLNIIGTTETVIVVLVPEAGDDDKLASLLEKVEKAEIDPHTAANIMEEEAFSRLDS